MRKIEDILADDFNFEPYEKLIEEIKNKRLAVYFGAGLSLIKAYKHWEYPFKYIAENLLPLIEKVCNSSNVDTAVQEKAKNWKCQLDDLNEILNSKSERPDYLAIGDELEKIINESYEAITSIRGNAGVCKSFNEFCVEAFTAHDFDKEVKKPSSPYKIDALMLLPCISGDLITTNVEKSYDRCVELCCDNVHIQKSIIIVLPNSSVATIADFYSSEKGIYYIHGHIREPNSLVMTGDSYDNTYGSEKNETGPRKVLRFYATNRSILFLGASLTKDKTVEVINDYAGFDGNILDNGRVFIDIAAPTKPGEKEPTLKRFRKILYKKDEFHEITFILLQLIRDTRAAYGCCKWHRPNANLKIPDNICDEKKLEEFLNSENLFSSITSDELGVEQEHYDLFINYLFRFRALKEENGKITGWSICYDITNNFTLDGYFPLHNYPLGNTIYVLYSRKNEDGDYTLYDKQGNEFEIRLKDWTNNVRKQHVEDLGDFEPRVRVIVFCLKEDRDEIEKKYDPYKNLLNQLIRSSLTPDALSPEAVEEIVRFLGIYNQNPQILNILHQIVIQLPEDRLIESLEQKENDLTKTLKRGEP